MANQRLEHRSSRTATYTCFSRGCATRESNPRFRGPDFLAERMFPVAAKVILNFGFARNFMIKNMFPPGIHEYVFARTKVFDAAFVEALDSGSDQIVLLGAGFDTRAMRFVDRNHSSRIFELDAPTTQKAKLDVLKRKHMLIPNDLVFANIDFDHESIFDVLSAAGYQSDKRNLFLWEGVTMYLTAPSVDSTLEFIRQTSAPGSRLVFDYIFASVLRRENLLYGEANIYEKVANVGETWTFGLEDGAIGAFLEQRGFRLIDHFTPVMLEKSFLSEPDGKLHARVNGAHCIVIAEVK